MAYFPESFGGGRNRGDWLTQVQKLRW